MTAPSPPHPDMTLAEIVTRDPGTTRLLEAHRLDYCCGGNETLGDACTAAGADLALVLAELTGRPPGPAADWSHLGPGALVDHIETTHHAYLHRELPRLAALADKVAHVHRSRHPELGEVAALVSELSADLGPHLAEEERVLFPMIRELAAATEVRALACGPLVSAIRVMLTEHDQAGELLARLRGVTHDYAVPADGCASYAALYVGLHELEVDTHLHVHKENNVLFPAVLADEHEPSA
jgi:regulator of cell morphogenesis and NO signaling